jgi:hypothetical protein
MKSLMKNCAISLAIIITISLFSCKPKKPIIVFNKSIISLDTLIAGQSKSVYFTIINIGNDTLKIEKFNCSCECTIPELSENTRIISSDSLVVKLTVKGYKSDKDMWKQVLCTFKTNSDTIFSRLKIIYFTKIAK